MKKGFVWMGAALAAVSVLGTSAVASASSHREAPAISFDPAADNTDLWAWMDADNSPTLHIVAAYNPMELPEGGPNFHKFSDDVLYEVHLSRGSKSVDRVVKYQVKFTSAPYKRIPLVLDLDATKARPNKDTKIGALAADPDGLEFFAQLAGGAQTYTVTKVVGGVSTVLTAAPASVAPANIGDRTNAVAYALGAASYESKFGTAFASALSNGGKTWAGPRDDGFYVDLGAFFDLANLRPDAGKDGVAGFNCHAIALDIPVTDIPEVEAADPFKDRVGVWATASRRKVSILRNDGSSSSYGPWVQVSREGLPLINEVIIGLQDKDKYNRTEPKDDVANFGPYILAPVLVRDAVAVGTYGAGAPAPAGTLDGRTDIIVAMNVLAPVGDPAVDPKNFPLAATGDVLRVELKTKSGFPNGRSLTGAAPNQEQADVTDVLATIVLFGLTKFAADGAVVKDGVNANDANFLTAIPYLASPWEGRRQGVSVRLGPAPALPLSGQ